jgi:hypothetical protein
MLLIAVVGVASVVALPLIFRDLDWFGTAAPLKDEKTVVLRAGETKQLQWDSPLVDKAEVTVKSPGNPVSVFVLLKADLPAALERIAIRQPPDIYLASNTWTENVTMEITPGKKPFALIIQTSSRRAEATATVRGR